MNSCKSRKTHAHAYVFSSVQNHVRFYFDRQLAYVTQWTRPSPLLPYIYAILVKLQHHRPLINQNSKPSSKLASPIFLYRVVGSGHVFIYGAPPIRCENVGVDGGVDWVCGSAGAVVYRARGGAEEAESPAGQARHQWTSTGCASGEYQGDQEDTRRQHCQGSQQ